MYTFAEFLADSPIPRDGIVGVVPECGHGSLGVFQVRNGQLLVAGGIEQQILPIPEFDLARARQWVERLVENLGRLRDERVLIVRKCPVCEPRVLIHS